MPRLPDLRDRSTFVHGQEEAPNPDWVRESLPERVTSVLEKQGRQREGM